MPTLSFSHSSKLGTLTIDTGLDVAQWAYNLNTQSYPTYGGEVIQILSVYIDDLTLSGTVTTYAQLGKIYSYFAQYMAIASQGNNPNTSAANDNPSSFNLDPITFVYPDRNWSFHIYPIEAPGFLYDLVTTAPRWQLVCHVIDDSPDITIIKNGIAGAAVNSIQKTLSSGLSAKQTQALGVQGTQLNISGNISPLSGDPNTDPFETFDANAQAQSAQSNISALSDYYNSLIKSYASGDYSSLTGIGSRPNTTPKPTKGNSPDKKTVHAPKSKPVQVP